MKALSRTSCPPRRRTVPPLFPLTSRMASRICRLPRRSKASTRSARACSKERVLLRPPKPHSLRSADRLGHPSWRGRANSWVARRNGDVLEWRRDRPKKREDPLPIISMSPPMTDRVAPAGTCKVLPWIAMVAGCGLTNPKAAGVRHSTYSYPIGGRKSVPRPPGADSLLYSRKTTH